MKYGSITIYFGDGSGRKPVHEFIRNEIDWLLRIDPLIKGLKLVKCSSGYGQYIAYKEVL